jgi:hypothetical protein
MHVVASFDKLRCDIGGFVSSDGSGDTEDDFHLSFKSQNTNFISESKSVSHDDKSKFNFN